MPLKKLISAVVVAVMLAFIIDITVRNVDLGAFFFALFVGAFAGLIATGVLR